MAKKTPLHGRANAVSCIVKADPDRFARGLANAEHDLKSKKDALMDELMRRALSQNPELAQALKQVEAQQEQVRDMRRAEEISLYHDWQAKRDAERIANRHRRYNDKLNKNLLSAVRRDWAYKHGTRLEQIDMEIARYYKPMSLLVPDELLAERTKLVGTRKAG